MSNTPSWILSYISRAVLINASSTLAAVLADVSMKMRPCSLAKASPSSLLTSLLASRSLNKSHVTLLFSLVRRMSYLLLPMSMMTMLLLLCCLASSSQVVKWLKVSRLVIS